MSIFTGRELEFLAGLNKSWWRLYWKEFSRLRRVEAAAANPAADILAFGAYDDDPTCLSRRCNGAHDATGEALHRRVELAAGNR